jgi:ubiquinone biosynthesis protein UbiJ
VSATDAPSLRLGHLARDGIAPSVYVLIERGASKRPTLARGARGVVELRFSEPIAPVRIAFTAQEILVEDGGGDEDPAGAGAPEPDLVVAGRLPDIIRLTTAPTVAGLPSPIDPRGRAVLGQLARGRVRVRGDRALGRRLLALMALD